MQGKTVVVTGATSGIGEVAAVALAKQGARIVFTARNPLRAVDTLARLRLANPDAEHSYHLADLTRLDGMRQAGERIARDAPIIDVLINNAGAMFGARQETADGLEQTFALNHMSYFVLTNLLLSNLKAAASARIVSTSSAAHRALQLNFDDLQCKNGYFAYVAYGRSKLCNILFTRELARRLQGTTVTANCLHPGFVATRFADSAEGLMRAGFGIAKKMGAIRPEEGAKTIVYLASSPEVEGVSGLYFSKCAPATPTSEALDDAAARRLWEVSAKIAGIEIK
jgi:NAD(P)-dependent dehydrogenase (short-subunit alcohol dehydrogenase family)